MDSISILQLHEQHQQQPVTSCSKTSSRLNRSQRDISGELLAQVENSPSLLAYSSSSLSSSSMKNDGCRGDEDPVDNHDVAALLGQKEKDLILAAELGKALLEKNEDLSQQNEKMAEEFSQRLEHLEQEKHRLRQQLDVMEDEYQQRVLELQADIVTLRENLQESTSCSKVNERERSTLVTQLTEQNQRLTSELQASAQREEELQSRIAQLRSQVTDKRMSMQDHVNHLEMLREEISLITRRKTELEKKVEELINERDGLTSTLDETSDKIVMLQRHTREQDCQLGSNQREMSELRASNQVLSERLELMSRSYSSGCCSSVHMSLLNEMEMSTSGSDSDRSLYQARRPCSQIDEEIEDIDDNVSSGSGGTHGGSSGHADDTVEEDSEMTCVNTDEMKQLKEEILSAYQQLRTLCSQMRQREAKRRQRNMSSTTDDSLETSSSEEYHLNQRSIHVGLLNESVLELKGLLHSLLRKDDLICEAMETHRTSETCDQMTVALKQNEVDLKRRDEEIANLQSQLSVLRVEMSAVEEERDTLRQDMADTTLSRDQLIRKAWEARDAAVRRKNAAEIELAKERIAGMQVNSQLLEAIQQKVELSQQLDQWQVDMEQLLEGQMRERLLEASHGHKGRSTTSSAMSTASDATNESVNSNQTAGRAASRFLSFFNRGSN